MALATSLDNHGREPGRVAPSQNELPPFVSGEEAASNLATQVVVNLAASHKSVDARHGALRTARKPRACSDSDPIGTKY